MSRQMNSDIFMYKLTTDTEEFILRVSKITTGFNNG